MDIHVAILGQFADHVAVILQAHDREPARIIRRLRRAHVQKPRSIRQLHHVVHVRRNANILVKKFARLINRNTVLRC